MSPPRFELGTPAVLKSYSRETNEVSEANFDYYSSLISRETFFGEESKPYQSDALPGCATGSLD